jgi:hypothetical protein
MGLLERAVAAATAAYLEVLELPEGTLGLVLSVYFDGDTPDQLAPPPTTFPRGALPWNSRDVGGEELKSPDVMESPELNALLERINDGGEAEGLLDEYLAAVALALHEALGVLVIVEGVDSSFGAPLRDQLLAQLSPEEAQEWRANDWLPRNRRADALLASLDIVAWVRVDPDRVAAVFERDGALYADSRLSSTEFSRKLAQPMQTIGNHPNHVLAGLLPAGAVSVSVQDLFDVWHDGLVGRGAWLCVLPHPERGPSPPVVFRDAAGQPVTARAASNDYERVAAIGLAADPGFDFDVWKAEERASERRVLEEAKVPLLWPADAAGPPTLSGWSDAGTQITLERPELSVTIASGELMVELADLLQERVQAQLGERAAARAALEAVPSKLSVRVLGRSLRFDAVSAGGAWAALRERSDPAIALSGDGPLPMDLHLVSIGPGDVQPRFAELEEG